MPTMEELATSYQPSMDDIAASYRSQAIGNIPEGQSVLPSGTEDMSGATGWEQGDYGKWKKIPSFMTKVKAMGSASAESLLDFSAALLNQKPGKGSFLDKYPSSSGESPAASAHDYWSDKNKQLSDEYSGLGLYQGIGHAIPEMAAFAVVDKGRSLLSKPIEAIGTALKGAQIPGTSLGIAGVNATGKALEKIGQGPAAIGAAAPFYTKTAAEYGSVAARDLATFSAVEGLRYNPDNPEAGFNSDKALELLENPSLAAAASMVGHKVGKWMGASRELGKAKDTYSKYATTNELRDPSPSRTIIAKAMGVLPNLFGVGKLVDQIKNLSDDTRTFVGNLLGNPDVVKHIGAGEKAGRYVQAALKRTELAENHAWNAVPKQTPIAETDHVKKIINNIVTDLKENSPIDLKFLKQLETFGNKSGFTSGDVKKIHTKIGSVLKRLYSHEDVALMAGEGGVINRIKAGKDGFLNILQGNLDDAGNAALAKARVISAQNFDLMGIAPVIPKAVKNGVAAQQIADKMISESTGGKAMSPILDKMSEQGKNAVVKYKILKSLDAHTNPDGSIQLEPFLKETGGLSNTGNLMGKDTRTAYEGFLKYLEGVNEAASTGWWTQMTVAGGLAAGATAKGGVSKILAGLVMASYPVLGFIANHAPIKTLLHAATRKLPDSTYNAVMKSVEKYLTRGGFYISNGVIRHKDEDKE